MHGLYTVAKNGHETGMPLKLSPFLCDHMVIQADVPTHYRGTADPRQKVEVRRGAQTASTVADDEGRWSIQLPPMSAGGPHEILFRTATEQKLLSDVLCGDVWVCSGQSNMEWPLRQSDGAEQEIPEAHRPSIRLFTTVRNPNLTPLAEAQGQWTPCTPETAANFSGVGYFFAKELTAATGRPIGLIGSYWGGTTAQAWTPLEALEKLPGLRDLTATVRQLSNDPASLQRLHSLAAEWRKVSFYQDPGNRAFFHGWAEADFADADWPEMPVPGHWQQRGLKHNGAVWFRKTIDIPAEWAGHDLELQLGALDDFDTTYWNGVHIGQTGEETTNWWMHQRLYRVPAGLIRPGQPNCITVRIFDRFGNGGFAGGGPIRVRPVGQTGEGLGLSGVWKYRIEYALPMEVPIRAQSLLATIGADNPNSPACLFNGMISPLTGFPIRGAIWYQGESNAGQPDLYATLFPTMIQAWRAAWAQPDMPFLFVLLANYMAPQSQPVETGWSELRAAQTAALALPHTAVVSALDVGDAVDIHPRDKKTVGSRLARAACRLVYGQEVVAGGPRWRENKREGSRLRIRFDNTEGGLTTRHGEPLRGFAVRSEEGPWLWAQAVIEGDTVVLEAPGLTVPAHAAYAWASNPSGNLSNGAGWPGLPFRTDL